MGWRTGQGVEVRVELNLQQNVMLSPMVTKAAVSRGEK